MTNPTEEEEVSRGVLLEALQGKWIASAGTLVEVNGSDLSMNGVQVPGGFRFGADERFVIGFGVFKATSVEGGVATWLAPGPMELQWRRCDDEEEIRARAERMQQHMHEKAATCGGQAFNVGSERDAVARLNQLLAQWREWPLVLVRSCDICPDWTNRAETGLSVDHVHYIATRISTDGFRSRRRGHDKAHDVPVLVRESAESQLGRGALSKWREATGRVKGFPPFLLDGSKEFFCSLGNGHFSQALNLFRVGAFSLWSDQPYETGEDDALREAIEEGVESVVLSADIPAEDRRFAAEMLNRAHGRTWRIGSDGRVGIDDGDCSHASEQFVALSKVLDAEELSCLVRRKLDVDVDGAVQGFLAEASHVSA